ncbi:MAG TPA: hypothetical protein VL689_12240 [Paraburkholderia sp.]|nr:hypothetical protein [Paraburkholderia sp.]
MSSQFSMQNSFSSSSSSSMSMGRIGGFGSQQSLSGNSKLWSIGNSMTKAPFTMARSFSMMSSYGSSYVRN